DHLAIFVDPVGEGALLRLKHKIKRVAGTVEPRLDPAEQRLEPITRHRRDEARAGGIACSLILDAALRGGVDKVRLVPDFEQAHTLRLLIYAQLRQSAPE